MATEDVIVRLAIASLAVVLTVLLWTRKIQPPQTVSTDLAAQGRLLMAEVFALRDDYVQMMDDLQAARSDAEEWHAAYQELRAIVSDLQMDLNHVAIDGRRLAARLSVIESERPNNAKAVGW